MNGDVLTDFDFIKFLKFHKTNNSLCTIAMFSKPVKVDLGVLKVDGENNLLDYIEKPTLNYQVSMGIYAFNKMVLDLFSKGKIFASGKENKRPFIFIKDVVKAYLTTINSSKNKIAGEIFNVGSNTQNITMESLANQIVGVIAKPCEITVQETNDHRSYFASFDKILSILSLLIPKSLAASSGLLFRSLRIFLNFKFGELFILILQSLI